MSDVVIIGAGAAGLFCAIEAGKRGHRVTLIEKNAQPGKKIIISGGGRCNFTNRDVSADNFVSRNPHFCKSALARFSSQDFIALVRKHRIDYYEKTLGQLFCKGSSRLILEMLLEECRKAGVRILTDCSVKRIAKDKNFTVESTKGGFRSDSLVIATGGLSFPKIGATFFGYQIARQFGINVLETRPSLVPLRFADSNHAVLSGLSTDSIAQCGAQEFRENILFTHRGLSGPAVLQISNYWNPAQPVFFNLLPKMDVLEFLESERADKRRIKNILSGHLPQRLINELLPEQLSNLSLKSASDDVLKQVANLLNRWEARFSETEGWDKAEVTLGGVDTDELSSKTMESKKVPGLYFIGEVVDVTGWLGGYNFQWAWSSGFACGQSV